MRHFDIAVVGAGPAGIAAAVAGARTGLEIVLIDESRAAGGQILSPQSIGARTQPESSAFEHGKALLAELQTLPIEVLSQTTVWAVEGNKLALDGPDGADEIEADARIIATGGREYTIPFPGWTLPGVMTLGGAQRLIKQNGVMPGKTMLITGSGPLLWALTASALENGGCVAAVLETGSLLRWWRALPYIGTVWDRMLLGLRYARTVLSHRIPIRFGMRVTRAHGHSQLQSVEAGGHTYEVDTLCIGSGFRPNIELLQLAGCKLEYDQLLGGWIPFTDEDMLTDQDGLYAAGECAGIGGAHKALLEGELAAMAASIQLGRMPTAADHGRMRRLRALRRRELRFASVLNRACEPPTGAETGIHADTVICRCESVRNDLVHDAIEDGIGSLDGLKIALRVGQGMCQGRTCGPVLRRVIAGVLNRPGDQIPPFHVRPPVKPVELKAIANRGDTH